MKVTQILCAAGPVDAVTNQALAYRALFRAWGWEGEDYSPVIAAGIPRGTFHHLHELPAPNGGALLLHYSGYARGIERILDRPQPSLLISHNITPPQYFWDSQPVDAVKCELAYGQLAELIERANRVAAVSEYNAGDLRRLGADHASVIPCLVDPGRLGPPAPTLPAGPPRILFVGRLVPHKRQDLIIRAFARFRQSAPEARLHLVGVPLSPAYGAGVISLADELAPGAVTFETAISAEALAARYREAHAFLCLSEHEGFCIPLLEAFHFGVPVVGRDAGAVGEVIGDAGVLLGAEDGVATIAELLRIVTTDSELRDELIARGRRRLEAFDHARVASELRATIESLAR
jgi:L-malate glycosyltransferase